MQLSNLPVFMVGMPRSGTSVLSEAVSVHEDFAWISNIVKWMPFWPQLSVLNRLTELPLVGNFMRGKKKQQSGPVAVLRRVLPRSDEAYPVWDRVCRNDFSSSYLAGESMPESEAVRAHAYFETIRKAHGKHRLFAKFTGPPRMRYLDSIFSGAYFIHVSRDPRAVVNSLLNVGFWREGGGLVRPWWEHGFGDDNLREWKEWGKTPEALAALQWRRVAELSAVEEKELPQGRIIRVRYEDFVDEPHAMLRRVFSGLGMRDSDRAHAYLENAGKLRNMNHKYEEQLTSEQIACVESITGKCARQCGYDV